MVSDTRGNASSEYAVLLAATLAAGLGAMFALGGAYEGAIRGDARGDGPVRVGPAVQAGIASAVEKASVLSRAREALAGPVETLRIGWDLAKKRRQKGPTVIEHLDDGRIVESSADGVARQLAYNPAVPVKRAMPSPVSFVRDLLEYRRRLGRQLDAITDEQLRWSIDRLGALELQEGILRPANGDLLNKTGWGTRKGITPSDFDDALLDRETLAHFMSNAMNYEGPADEYQFAGAHALHDRFPRIGHYMGVTLPESINAAALRGKSAPQSIWVREEKRHAHILETVHNAGIADGSIPKLETVGTAARLPETSAHKAKATMALRARAELSAGMAYALLRANAVEGSPAYHALDGILRDEIYHYVLMTAGNKVGYGQNSRWTRLFHIVKHGLDYPVPKAVDGHVYRRAFPPKALAMAAYTFLTIDKKIDRFVRSIPEGELRALVGPTYAKDADLAAHLERTGFRPTGNALQEQNPSLTAKYVEEISERFPGTYSADARRIDASYIEDVQAVYRKTRLETPSYWLSGKRGYEEARPGVVERLITPGATARIDFGAEGGPVMGVYSASGIPFVEVPMRRANMRQIGAFMDAEQDLAGGKDFVDVMREIRTARALGPQEIVDIVWRKGEGPTLVGAAD